MGRGKMDTEALLTRNIRTLIRTRVMRATTRSQSCKFYQRIRASFPWLYSQGIAKGKAQRHEFLFPVSL